MAGLKSKLFFFLPSAFFWGGGGLGSGEGVGSRGEQGGGGSFSPLNLNPFRSLGTATKQFDLYNHEGGDNLHRLCREGNIPVNPTIPAEAAGHPCLSPRANYLHLRRFKEKFFTSSSTAAQSQGAAVALKEGRTLLLSHTAEKQ